MTSTVSEPVTIDALPELPDDSAIEKAALAHANKGTLEVDRDRSAYHQAGHAVALTLTGISFASMHSDWAGRPWRFDGLGLATSPNEAACNGNPHIVEMIAAAGYLAEVEYLQREYGLTREAAMMYVARGDCAAADVRTQGGFSMVERGRRMVVDEWELIKNTAQLLGHHSLTHQDMVNLVTGRWPQ
ncbi:hypothetical protein ACFC06_24965 [Nocardia sp. NPDC056064]|uniref:hypothetical protein n=1 Tax=Nocardia sp. NPDC056064 TaxID=3345701 RepID=UPI0035E25692